MSFPSALPVRPPPREPRRQSSIPYHSPHSQNAKLKPGPLQDQVDRHSSSKILDEASERAVSSNPRISLRSSWLERVGKELGGLTRNKAELERRLEKAEDTRRKKESSRSQKTGASVGDSKARRDREHFRYSTRRVISRESSYNDDAKTGASVGDPQVRRDREHVRHSTRRHVSRESSYNDDAKPGDSSHERHRGSLEGRRKEIKQEDQKREEAERRRRDWEKHRSALREETQKLEDARAQLRTQYETRREEQRKQSEARRRREEQALETARLAYQAAESRQRERNRQKREEEARRLELEKAARERDVRARQELQQRRQTEEAERRERRRVETAQKLERRRLDEARRQEEFAREWREAEERRQRHLQRRALLKEAEERCRRRKLRDCAACLDSEDKAGMVELPCSHWYCNNSIRAAFEAALNGSPSQPFLCCGQVVPITLYPNITPAFRLRYNMMLLERSTKNPVYCSNHACGQFIPPLQYYETDWVRCAACKYKTCRLCRSPAHKKTICLGDEGMKQVVELATEKGWRRCGHCGEMVEKLNGCNHMMCRCRSQWCYVCGSKEWRKCGH